MIRVSVLAVALAAHAQTGGPTFEAASVKPASAEEIAAGAAGIPTRHGRVTGINVTLKRCIVGAYHIGPGQVVGGPSWIDSDRFHIEAKAEADITDDAVMDAMLRNLLAERLHLVVHRETREMRALVLGVAKRGAKLQEGELNDAVTNAGHGRITLKNSTLEALAERLSRATDWPVLNETGMEGVFNLKLEWTPDGDRPNPDGPPDLMTAMREQLGLTLKSKKAPVNVLVVDHAEKPGEN
jgi:uncharacterized protein (TIGR03435 family)